MHKLVILCVALILINLAAWKWHSGHDKPNSQDAEMTKGRMDIFFWLGGILLALGIISLAALVGIGEYYLEPLFAIPLASFIIAYYFLGKARNAFRLILLAATITGGVISLVRFGVSVLLPSTFW